jgi:hypothetical protein
VAHCPPGRSPGATGAGGRPLSASRELSPSGLRAEPLGGSPVAFPRRNPSSGPSPGPDGSRQPHLGPLVHAPAAGEWRGSAVARQSPVRPDGLDRPSLDRGRGDWTLGGVCRRAAGPVRRGSSSTSIAGRDGPPLGARSRFTLVWRLGGRVALASGPGHGRARSTRPSGRGPRAPCVLSWSALVQTDEMSPRSPDPEPPGATPVVLVRKERSPHPTGSSGPYEGERCARGMPLAPATLRGSTAFERTGVP